MEDNPSLGRSMQSHSFALGGVMSSGAWYSVLSEIIDAIGMTPVYKPAIWNYPFCGGGGNGQTIVQPITESFLALDIWPDHAGAYLVVCSCRPFDPQVIKGVLSKWKVSVTGECGHNLSIPQRRPANEQTDPMSGFRWSRSQLYESLGKLGRDT